MLVFLFVKYCMRVAVTAVEGIWGVKEAEISLSLVNYPSVVAAVLVLPLLVLHIVQLQLSLCPLLHWLLFFLCLFLASPLLSFFVAFLFSATGFWNVHTFWCFRLFIYLKKYDIYFSQGSTYFVILKQTFFPIKMTKSDVKMGHYQNWCFSTGWKEYITDS